MSIDIPRETVEALFVAQPLGVLQLMLRMGEHLRDEVHQLFPHLTTAEHLAVCEMVVYMMREGMEEARGETRKEQR